MGSPFTVERFDLDLNFKSLGRGGMREILAPLSIKNLSLFDES